MAPGRARAANAPQASPELMPAPPAGRRLRIFATDPGASAQCRPPSSTSPPSRFRGRTGGSNDNLLSRGPVGEYLEVVDIDPASAVAYDPVDLNDPFLLAQDGLSPSEGNPQFHQQMVYAVAMRTIRNFETALGRRALWAEREVPIAATVPTKRPAASAYSSADCGSIRMRCAKPMPTTARKSGPCCSGISRPTARRPAHGVHLPLARHRRA